MRRTLITCVPATVDCSRVSDILVNPSQSCNLTCKCLESFDHQGLNPTLFSDHQERIWFKNLLP